MPETVTYELVTLIKRLSALMYQHIDQRLKPYDLARTQYIVLYRLHVYPDISTSELAESMEIEPATLSGIADVLQAKDLVQRVDYAADKRRKDIRLTEKGKQLVASIPPPGPEVERVLLHGIDRHEAAIMKSVGEQMLENLKGQLKQEGGQDAKKA